MKLPTQINRDKILLSNAYWLYLYGRRVEAAKWCLLESRQARSPGTKKVYLNMAKLNGSQARGYLQRYMKGTSHETKLPS